MFHCCIIRALLATRRAALLHLLLTGFLYQQALSLREVSSVVTSESWSQNQYYRESYSSVVNGGQPIHAMPSSHNFSNQDNVQGTEIVSPSLQASDIVPSARSYNTGASEQTLIDHSEQFPSHYSTETNLRDLNWTRNEEQTNPYKTGMADTQLVIAEDQVISHQTFNRGKANHSEGQYSNTESFLEKSGHGNTTVYAQQNVSTFRIYHGPLDGNQSGVVEYIPEQKMPKNTTLSDSHFQKVPLNETHQTEMLGQYHGNEQSTLNSQGSGRTPALLRQDVENAAQEQTILTQNQSSNSHQNGGHKVERKVGHSTESLKKRYNEIYNISSLSQGQDTELLAIPANQRKDDVGFLGLDKVPAHQNITRQQNADPHIRHVSPVTPDSNVSNNHYLHQTQSPESHTGQEVKPQLNHSGTVLYTEPSPGSHVPVPYNEQNSGQDHESRMNASLGVRSKNQLSTKGRYATENMDTSEESKIVFPGELLSNTVVKFLPQVRGQQPICADEYGICENADNYPQDHVRRLFLQNETNSYFFGTDLMDINLRINPDEEVSLCPSMEQVVYPKLAQSKDDKWLYVINQDTYIQGIRIEKCARQGSCTFAENFPSGYTTSCQQKYVYRKLLALGEDGKPITDSFRLPSCCSCIITKSYRSRRMAGGTGRSQIPSRRTRRRK